MSIYIDEVRTPKVIAFFGRPNAGKSSCARRMFGVKLRVGKYPGSTKKVEIRELTDFIIIDLPGWGYIRGFSLDKTQEVKDSILSFFNRNSGNINTLVIVIDITTYEDASASVEKKGLLPVEVDAIHFFSEHVNKIIILANKIDKLSEKALQSSIDYLSESLRNYTGLDLEIHRCSAKKWNEYQFTRLKDIIVN